jgi:hypothetical protein
MMDGRGAFGRVGLLLCAVASGGCDLLFQIDRVPARDDANGPNDTLGDGRLTDGDMLNADAATACANPSFYEPFTGSTACSAFGASAYMTNADVTQMNGVFSVTPHTSGAQNPNGGCSTPAADIPFKGGSGLTIIVNRSVMGTGAYTNVLARGANAQIQVLNGSLHFQNASGGDIGSPVPYNPIAMRWWRIQPVGSNAMSAAYSSDGEMWTPLGAEYMAVPPDHIGIDMTVGAIPAGIVGTTIIDQIMVCP